MSDYQMTFGVVDQIDIAAPHIVSVRGGSPLADMPESAHPAWASGAAIGTYAVGASVYRAISQRVYERITAHTAVETTPPEQNPVDWLDVGPTNTWSMFDIYRYTAARAQHKLQITIRPQQPVDTVYLGGIVCSDARITITEGLGGPVVELRDDPLWSSGRDDWQKFFLAPVVVHDSVLLTLDSLVADPVITVEIDNPDDTAALGNLVIGRRFMFGGTRTDADIGPVSYTGWEEALDGTVRITRRPGAGDMNVSVVVPPENASAVVALLKRYDARPALWIASPRETPWLRPMREYGVFNGRLRYPNTALCELTGRIKGMV